MGKDSKHQRTKGGVQPSNSSRTAELLHKSGGSGGGALSFLSAAAEAHLEFGVKPPPSTVLTSLLIDDDLPPEVRMVFRKLQKKDAVTKIKALAELAQILGAPPPPRESNPNSPSSSRETSMERPRMSREELEDLSKLLLPHYIKAYQKLVLDDSRKVREQAQLTLAQLCTNVGRNLAPFLKQLMPSWYLAQNDLYSPVASAGKKAFVTVFTAESKRVEVVKFCKGDIIRVVVDHLQSVFRTGKGAEQGASHKEKKQQKGKKKGQHGQEVPTDIGGGDEVVASTPAVPPAPPTSGSGPSDSNRGDGESFALRITCASLQSLKSLIEQGLVEDDTLEDVFGRQGLFWCGSEITKELLIRRNMYDILSSLTNYLQTKTQTTTEAPCFTLPADKCAKFINAALSSNQKETLPNLWNTFLHLTLSGVLSDIHLARKQLLTCCKHGFYGNASQIGSSVLPLLARIWEGFSSDDGNNSKHEFSHDIISSTILGYGSERSLFEKASIARTLGEIIAFLCNRKVIEMSPVYAFVFSNLTELNGDFAKMYGSLVKDREYYEGLIDFAFGTSPMEVVNSKEFGTFIVNLSMSSYDDTTQHSSKPGAFRRRVQFQEECEETSTTTNIDLFNSLPQQKQDFLQSVVSHLVQSSIYKPLIVLSRKFKDVRIWSTINILEIQIPPEEDKLTRLQLYLELINVAPELPALLGKFSDEFENFHQNPGDFKVFLKQVDSYTHLGPIKKWVRMPHFTSVVESLLLAGSLEESELQTILKFVFRDLFPPDFVEKIIGTVTERIGRDPSFSDDLSHILVSSNFRADLTQIYKYYWESYFLKSVLAMGESPENLELIETVCFRNLGKLDVVDVAQILEKYLESCDKTKQIDILIDINKRLGFSGEILQPLPQSQLKIRHDFLSFLDGVNYTHEIGSDGLDPVPKFSKIHRSFISKGIFKGKLILDTPDTVHEDLIVPLLNVLYAQSLAKVWDFGEKSSYFENLNRELSSELDVVSSRLIEKVYEDKNAWKRLWELVESSCEEGGTGADALWGSKLPLRILGEYCAKAEMTSGLKKIAMVGPEEAETFAQQVDLLLEDLSRNVIPPVHEVISWITEKRVKCPEAFEFDTVFKHVKDKVFVNKLLIITIELMTRVEKGDEITEEFLSLAACWISAWLKGTKSVNLGSKKQLVWVVNLARAVQVLGGKARNLDQLCPKFVQEYAEFHASQLYPVIYAVYVLLNKEEVGGGHSFWTLEALLEVGKALVTCPGGTLAYIEPDGVKLCEIFGQVVGHGVSLPSKITAYRILKKVRYDRTGEGDLPIVPPVIGDVIKTLVSRLYEDSEEVLISYLMIWDALLKIQQGSNEFATYVRDQEHLLTPFLNTLFFSERISLENASGKNFEKDLQLNPDSMVNLLQLSCSVVQRTLRNLPYTVRWWWNNQVTRQRDRVFVEKFIVKYLSSKLAAEELGSVKLREGVDDNVTVHCHSGCNELIAHYRIEETNVTLTVSLPLNHPLGPVTVKISDKKLHGKISHLLNTRSHSLSAGLKLWKENLDGLYKDVDECAICFFILHNITKQIPKLGCKTCKKKFHAACLYKWFSTSNKSECPLCRNLF